MRREAVALVFLAGTAAAAVAQTPAGGEFRVSVFAPGEQKLSSVAVGPGADFMIVWNSLNQDGAGFGVFGQRFDAFGQRLGGEFQVNTATLNLQYVYGGAIAADRSGNYIVVWTSSAPGQDGSGRGIMGRIYARSGVPLTAEFPVNVFTAGRQNAPAVAALPGAEFVVVWESPQDGSLEAVIGRKFDSAGRPLTGEFLVNVHTPSIQKAARVDSDAAGNFTVVWMSYLQDGSLWGAFGRRFNAAAAPLGGEFVVSTYTPLAQRYPVVSAVPDGRFAVVWEDQDRDGNRFGIYGQRYDANGNPVGGDTRLNVYTTDHQHTPTVAAFGDGSFMAAWYSQDQLSFNNQDVYARRVLEGAPGAELLVNANTAFQQFLAASDADEAGNVVVSWTTLQCTLPQPQCPLPLDYAVDARRYGGLVPWSLGVDAIAVGSSNGNRVFEKGETVVVQPAWRNVSGTTLAFDGTATGFAGPLGAVYTISDGGAGYGSVPNGNAGACGFGAGCYALTLTAPIRPVEHWDAQFREDIQPASLGHSKAWALHIGESFSDVPRTNPFYRFAETAYHRGVITSCASFQFCPSLQVPRDQMAMMVLKAKDPHWVPTACIAGQEMFADVPAASPYCRWVEELARRGVVAGCGGGNYCPSLFVSREQLAVYLLGTLEGTAFLPPACGTPLFNDVPASSPFCRWIEELARRGVVAGCGGGAYCPTLVVARDQMSVFLTVTFGLTLYGP